MPRTDLPSPCMHLRPGCVQGVLRRPGSPTQLVLSGLAEELDPQLARAGVAGRIISSHGQASVPSAQGAGDGARSTALVFRLTQSGMPLAEAVSRAYTQRRCLCALQLSSLISHCWEIWLTEGLD